MSPMAQRRLLVGRVLVVAWRAPEHEDLVAVIDELREREHAPRAASCSTCRSSGRKALPQGTVRDALVGFYRDSSRRCDSMHVVIEGNEFEMSIKRSVIANVLLVVQGRGRIFIENTLDRVRAASPHSVRGELDGRDARRDRAVICSSSRGASRPCHRPRRALRSVVFHHYFALFVRAFYLSRDDVLASLAGAARSSRSVSRGSSRAGARAGAAPRRSSSRCSTWRPGKSRSASTSPSSERVSRRESRHASPSAARFTGRASAPERSAEIVTTGTVIGPEHVELAFTEATQSLFCGAGDRAAHTTFEGDVEVAFAAAAPGAPPIAGELRHVVLDVRPGADAGRRRAGRGGATRARLARHQGEPRPVPAWRWRRSRPGPARRLPALQRETSSRASTACGWSPRGRRARAGCAGRDGGPAPGRRSGRVDEGRVRGRFPARAPGGAHRGRPPRHRGAGHRAPLRGSHAGGHRRDAPPPPRPAAPQRGPGRFPAPGGLAAARAIALVGRARGDSSRGSHGDRRCARLRAPRGDALRPVPCRRAARRRVCSSWLQRPPS